MANNGIDSHGSNCTSRLIPVKSRSGRRKPDLSSLRKLRNFRLFLLDVQVFIGACRYYPDYTTRGGVHRLSDKVIVKHADPNRVRLSEAIALDFLATHTTIPVPRVHDVFYARDETWIVMEYIDASLLSDVWRGLSEEDKLHSMMQLKGYMDQLRALEPPEPGKVQSVDGKGCTDARIWSEPTGPFATIDEFQQWCGRDIAYKEYPEYREFFDKVRGKDHRIVFSHGDLAPHNIMWRDGRIVAIIDWERSGWFPEYWDYAMSRMGSLANDNWWEMYDRIMTRYPDELAVELVYSTVFTRI